MQTLVKRAAVAAGLVVAASIAPTASQAAFLGTGDLNYAGGSSPYCSNGCINSTYPSAGTVTVTLGTGAQLGDLLFDVDLNSGFTFQNNHNASFAFSLISGLSGVQVQVLNTDTGTNASDWNAAVSGSGGAGDGVGNNPWSYFLNVKTAQVESDLEFVVSASTALTLADLAQTSDKEDPAVPLWFIADVSSPIGSGHTGYVGDPQSRITTSEGTTPLPAALPLMGTVLGFGYLVGWRRKRRAAVAA